jgi:predicted DNA-binding protein YlxM (UPF0122 family)
MPKLNDVLHVENSPIVIIAETHTNNDESISKLANKFSISEDAVQEAISFTQNHPLEVHRDALKMQRNHIRRQLAKPQRSLNSYLKTCSNCGNGRYVPVNIHPSETTSKIQHMHPELCSVHCSNCNYIPQ